MSRVLAIIIVAACGSDTRTPEAEARENTEVEQHGAESTSAPEDDLPPFDPAGAPPAFSVLIDDGVVVLRAQGGPLNLRSRATVTSSGEEVGEVSLLAGCEEADACLTLAAGGELRASVAQGGTQCDRAAADFAEVSEGELQFESCAPEGTRAYERRVDIAAASAGFEAAVER